MRNLALVFLGLAVAASATSQLPCICTREYMPVCASDGVTYPNDCTFRCAARENADLKVVAEGECTHSFERSVPCVCTQESAPVCASDGQTYPNYCTYKCHARANKDLHIIFEAACPFNSPEPKSARPLCACSREYNPICGSDGVTYANPCLFKCQKTANQDLSVAHFGECDKRGGRPICACTMEYMPLCGSDGVTYSNKCLLKCQQRVDKSLTSVHFGRCDQKAELKMNRPLCICTREYEPVCGTDGQTYDNLCLLQCQQGVQPGLTVVHGGRCEPIPMAKSGKAICACNRMLWPVCGSDGQTYDNPCLLACQQRQNSNLRQVHEGPCEKSAVQLRSQKACPCNLIFRPVCGTDGNTYDNECALNCQAKNGNADLKVFHQGACFMPFTKASGACSCNRIYLPVCGSDAVSYNNPCILECQQKRNPGLTIAHYGRCAEELTQLKVSPACKCTRIYKPVCGTDGSTYNNECLLNCQRATNNRDLKILHFGPCGEATKSRALPPCMCPRNYMPVCGTDGVTYSNECMLICQKATKNADLKVFHEGVCAVPIAARASAGNSCRCNRMYMPVCGSDRVTYNNLCLFGCQQKQNKFLTIVHEGRCEESTQPKALAPCMCPRNYQPVCGTDGVTYSNECMLNCAKATQNSDLNVFHSGMCIIPVAKRPVDDDICFCTDDYTPVCGSDQKTYANKCMFECVHRKQNKLTIAHNGECKPTTPVDVPCVCPRVYFPVCGSDGQTYDNRCLLECTQKTKPGLTMKHEDEC